MQIAAPTAKELQFVVHDFVEGFDTYTEKPGHTWPADVAFAGVDPSDYVALVLSGGRARVHPWRRRLYPDRQALLRGGQAGRGTVPRPTRTRRRPVIDGRGVSACPACALDVRAAGAEWIDSEAPVDGLLVTGRAWPDHPAWTGPYR